MKSAGKRPADEAPPRQAAPQDGGAGQSSATGAHRLRRRRTRGSTPGKRARHASSAGGRFPLPPPPLPPLLPPPSLPAALTPPPTTSARCSYPTSRSSKGSSRNSREQSRSTRLDFLRTTAVGEGPPGSALYFPSGRIAHSTLTEYLNTLRVAIKPDPPTQGGGVETASVALRSRTPASTSTRCAAPHRSSTCRRRCSATSPSVAALCTLRLGRAAPGGIDLLIVVYNPTIPEYKLPAATRRPTRCARSPRASASWSAPATPSSCASCSPRTCGRASSSSSATPTRATRASSPSALPTRRAGCKYSTRGRSPRW